VTLAELRGYAPENPEAWEARLEEIGAAARYLAFAARRPTLDRSRWFARAWKLVTEIGK
jgi:hypothetical protein